MFDKQDKLAVTDDIRQDFLDAIERIKRGAPTNEHLKKKLKRGLLRLNISNVALEASRGLSTLHTKKYRDLKSLISGTPRKPGKNSLIDLLKAEVRVLKQNLERSELRLGEVEVTLVRAERSLEQAIATQERFAQDNKRLRRRLAEMVQN